MGDSSGLHCWSHRPTEGAGSTSQNIQFVHTPNVIVMLNENDFSFRIIPIDGRPLERSSRPVPLGDSIGRWEGDTLVVEVTNIQQRNFRNELWSPGLRLVERWTRPDAKTVENDLVIEDPKFLTAPWAQPRVRREKLTYEAVLESYCVQDESLDKINARSGTRNVDGYYQESKPKQESEQKKERAR